MRGPDRRLSFRQASRLARISGRDGRIIWDVAVSQNSFASHLLGTPVRGFDDLDGDGGIDAVVGSWLCLCRPRRFSTGWSPSRCATARGCGRRRLGMTCLIPARFMSATWTGTNGPMLFPWRDSRRDKGVRIRVLDGRDGKACWSFSPAVKDSGTHLWFSRISRETARRAFA